MSRRTRTHWIAQIEVEFPVTPEDIATPELSDKSRAGKEAALQATATARLQKVLDQARELLGAGATYHIIRRPSR